MWKNKILATDLSLVHLNSLEFPLPSDIPFDEHYLEIKPVVVSD